MNRRLDSGCLEQIQIAPIPPRLLISGTKWIRGGGVLSEWAFAVLSYYASARRRAGGRRAGHHGRRPVWDGASLHNGILCTVWFKLRTVYFSFGSVIDRNISVSTVSFLCWSKAVRVLLFSLVECFQLGCTIYRRVTEFQKNGKHPIVHIPEPVVIGRQSG